MSLSKRYTWLDHNSGPFLLVLDDFGTSNMIVNNREELRVVGVFDLEWSYSGPAQLFATAPWLLLQERPNSWLDSADRTERFLRHLTIFTRLLEEEEEKRTPSHHREKLSTLARRSQETGAMWYHMVIQGFFNDPKNLPCARLMACTPDWEALAGAIPGKDIQDFNAKKMADLELHDSRAEATEARYNWMIKEGSIPGFLKTVEGFYKVTGDGNSV